MHRDENGAAQVQDKTKPKKNDWRDEHLKLYRIQFVKVKRNVNKHFDGIWMETTDRTHKNRLLINFGSILILDVSDDLAIDKKINIMDWICYDHCHQTNER